MLFSFRKPIYFFFTFEIIEFFPMDEKLKLDMEHVLTLNDDVEFQAKSISKILVYLNTMTLPDPSNHSLLKRFLIKAFEVLPSSSLPQQLSIKLNIPIERKRSISFTNSYVHRLFKSSTLSKEGEEQLQRESGILCINNIDVHRKFHPIHKTVPGLKCITSNISIVEGLLVNSFNPVDNTEILKYNENHFSTISFPNSNNTIFQKSVINQFSSSNREITLPNITISEMIESPNLFHHFN